MLATHLPTVSQAHQPPAHHLVQPISQPFALPSIAPAPAPIPSQKPAIALPQHPIPTAVVASHPPGPRPTPSSCAHLGPLLAELQDAAKRKGGKLALGLKWAYSLSGADAKRRRLASPKCLLCTQSTTRPLLCLECGSVFCSALESSQGHAARHSHPLFLDLRSKSVWCRPCAAYVHHPAIEREIGVELIRYEEGFVISNTGATKRKVTPYIPWTPASPPTAPVIRALPRGMRNLGQTCYMSVVLQSMLHNPLMKAHFLSDAHNRSACSSTASANQEDGAKNCLSCELDRLFEEAYSSEPAPFAPTRILHSVWMSSAELSGYAQQDAHEFLISALNLLHSSASPSSSPLISSGGSDAPSLPSSSCNCIVHRVFAGQLRSEVTCGQCGNKTRSEDPFLDLSLDLKGAAPLAVQTLTGCLNRFTTPENLPAKEYSCAKCGDSQAVASKRLSLHKLPPVLCLQLKRFERLNSAQATSIKIDHYVRFPLSLDLRPFCSSSTSTAPDSLYEYQLASVICHEGQLNNGHFTSFILNPDDGDFYAYDDEKVRRVELAEVLRQKAYLLEYVRKTVAFA